MSHYGESRNTHRWNARLKACWNCAVSVLFCFTAWGLCCSCLGAELCSGKWTWPFLGWTCTEVDHGSRTEPNLFGLLALQILPKLNLREKNQIIQKGLSASTCKAASLALGTKYLEYHSGAALFSCWTALSCLWGALGSQRRSCCCPSGVTLALALGLSVSYLVPTLACAAKGQGLSSPALFLFCFFFAFPGEPHACGVLLQSQVKLSLPGYCAHLEEKKKKKSQNILVCVL